MQLVIRDLSKRYANGVQAIDHVSLTIPPGMFGLLGPNGAGKSTLMRTLATLQSADSGSATLGDIDILHEPGKVRAVLGYLPQDFGVYPKVSALELLDHLARLKGLVDRGSRRETVDALLHRVNLYDVRKQKLGGFSGGMRQRFGIAQALIGNPKLIIVDEPTAGLDPEERVRFHNLLADIAADVVVILSTHIVSDVADLCSNLAIINRGTVLLTGEPATLVADIRGHIWRRVVTKTEAETLKATVPIVSTRLQAGRTIVRAYSKTSPGAGFEPVEADLEDVYFCTIAGHLAEPVEGKRPEHEDADDCVVRFHPPPADGIDLGLLRALRLPRRLVDGRGRWRAHARRRQFRRRQDPDRRSLCARDRHRRPGLHRCLRHRLGGRARRAAGFRVFTYHFFFTAPIAKRDYFFGRLLGAYMTLALIFIGIVLGVLIGIHWPGVDPARVVDAPSWLNFVRPYLFLLLPNMLWLGGCFFVFAALTRQMAPVYVAGVITLVGYLFAVNLLGDMDNKILAALIDPSGATAVDVFTRYWSVAQKNTQQIPIEGVLLVNRAIWLGFGLLVTAIGYRVFSMQAVTTFRRSKRALAVDAELPRPRRLQRRCRQRGSIAVPARLPACCRD